jgi:EAL domain-containing protein (putative c-di-GMP-specific phosphodiesterase class I)/GGDEF domain-containing protein
MKETAAGTDGSETFRRARAGLIRLKSALFDPVTGLYSYHLRVDELRARLEGRPLGVIVVDFPALGDIESAHGWEVTDRLLSGVASLLGALVSREWPLGTLLALEGVYGSSFLLFVQEGTRGRDVSTQDLAGLAGSLSVHLERRLRTAAWAPPPPPVDHSVGFSLVRSAPSARFERLLHQAICDARGMVTRDADQVQRDRAEALRAILAGGRLTTLYQPIVDLEQVSIMGYEALSRGPENTGLSVPEVLFAVSGRIRLSLELDALCLCQAVRNARGFDPTKKLFLNSLSERLENQELARGGLSEAMEESGIEPRNLVLEISERTGIVDFESFGRDLQSIRKQGILIAIDDVGTGYSSLQAISEVQPDFIKVDISLVKNIHQSLIKQELVRSLLRVAARIGAQVIAEGIESEEECRSLRSCGVRYGQGYFFARPAPPFAALHRQA